MKVSGFSFVRNALMYDYPVAEAISSILPLCDEVVVAVGNSDDDTLPLVQSIDPRRVRVIETEWDDSLREGGRVLAQETDKALDAIAPDSDWAFYIQADEVIHEQDLPCIRNAMQTWKDDPRVQGLLFDYKHFYGSYRYVGDSHRWYRKDIRVIRNDDRIRSWHDAQGFRHNGRKLRVKPANATVYHYGWVKHPDRQQAKQKTFHKFWHSDEWVQQNVSSGQAFDYSAIDSLAEFDGTHPGVMAGRVAAQDWVFTFDPSRVKLSIEERFHRFTLRTLGLRLGENRNYRLL